MRVKPGAKVPSIDASGETLVVAVRERAQENRANEAVRHALAEHYDVPPSQVRLIRGAAARIKAFQVDL